MLIQKTNFTLQKRSAYEEWNELQESAKDLSKCMVGNFPRTCEFIDIFSMFCIDHT